MNKTVQQKAPLWSPSNSQKKQSALWRFADFSQNFHAKPADDYAALHRWSIESQEDFYSSLWDFLEIVGDKGKQTFIDNDDIRKVQYFPDARVNYAENLLQNADDRLAIIAHRDDGTRRSISRKELYAKVSQLVQALQADGVVEGDCIAGIVNNDIDAIIAYLASASIGAVWASCSPDFGPSGASDRLCQLAPKVLFAVSNYSYGGKFIDVSAVIKAVSQGCELSKIILLSENLEQNLQNLNCISLDDYLTAFVGQKIPFKRLPFDAPLVVLFSSGTTGKPKGIVHSAMGLLIQHKKEQVLHCDIKKNERFFYFTTCGWMMWNWLISGLASEATLITYDGNPFYPEPERLLDLIDEEDISVFGTSAKYIDACLNAGLAPESSHQLTSLRLVLSTGSPLLPASFDYLYEKWKADMQVASISGGTDICACFLGGNPLLPVYKGELQCSLLGMDVDVIDEEGRSVVGQSGELVCRNAHLSMPLSFWQDEDRQRYNAAYFNRFPGLWAHGDFVEKCVSGAYVIHGRSDTTLNPGGVRIGTAEIYRQLTGMSEVLESIAVGQDWQGDQRVILFVKLHRQCVLGQTLITKIKQQIRTGASPRHVPAKIIAVDDIPRTASGKISEVAVRDVIHARPLKNRSALANPQCLKQYENIAALKE